MADICKKLSFTDKVFHYKPGDLFETETNYSLEK